MSARDREEFERRLDAGDVVGAIVAALFGYESRDDGIRFIFTIYDRQGGSVSGSDPSLLSAVRQAWAKVPDGAR